MGKHIFLVDDDPVIRALVGDYLGMSGHTVEPYASGPECLIRLKRGTPDLVILDMQMPDMTGAEVLSKIRQNPACAKVLVLMLSGNDDTEGVTLEQYNVRADTYLQKPFDMKELLQTVNAIP